MSSKITTILIVSALGLLCFGGLGCSHPKYAVLQGARIAVFEFRVAETADVTRYRDSYDGLGMLVAQRIADQLRAHDRNAAAIPAGRPVDADLVVSGNITRIDGGNRALRVLIGMGAGGSSCAVGGDLARADGTRLGTFTGA